MFQQSRLTFLRRSILQPIRTSVEKLLILRRIILEKVFLSALGPLPDGDRFRVVGKLSTTELLSHVPPGMLTPIGQFFRDGHNDRLFERFDLDCHTALVLGGYLGDSVQLLIERNDLEQLFVIEPIEHFAQKIRARFSDDDRITVITAAATDRTGTLKMMVNGESTGQFSSDRPQLDVPCLDISDFVRRHGPFAVVEINIEGGEFAVLESLLSAGLVDSIQILLIQFHRVVDGHEDLRQHIRDRLGASHWCRYSYDWVWERWDRSDGTMLPHYEVET